MAGEKERTGRDLYVLLKYQVAAMYENLSALKARTDSATS